MKITIKNGSTFQSALEEINTFLKDRYSEYPQLEGDMEICINLKNNSETCPENDKEYNLCGNIAVDAVEAAKIRAYNEAAVSLVKTLEEVTEYRDYCTCEITKAETYLATAAEKGRKAENIEKRKKKLQRLLEDREEAEHAIHAYTILRKLCKQHKVTPIFNYRHRIPAECENLIEGIVVALSNKASDLENLSCDLLFTDRLRIFLFGKTRFFKLKVLT